MLAPKVVKPKPEASVSRTDERQRAAKSLRPSARPPGGARADAWDVGRIALFPPSADSRRTLPPPRRFRVRCKPSS